MKLVKRTKLEPEQDSQGTHELVPVLVEPLPGHSDEEVLSLLDAVGGADVVQLAPGFISAELEACCLESVRKIAYVHPKAMKQMRRPRGTRKTSPQA